MFQLNGNVGKRKEIESTQKKNEKPVIFNNVKNNARMKDLDIKRINRNENTYVYDEKDSNKLDNEVKGSERAEIKIELDSKKRCGLNENTVEDTNLCPGRSNEIIRKVFKIKGNECKNRRQAKAVSEKLSKCTTPTYNEEERFRREKNEDMKTNENKKNDVIGTKTKNVNTKYTESYVQPVEKVSWADVVRKINV